LIALSAGSFAFVTLAINPLGGLLVAIPFAVFKLGWPAWLAVVAGTPLAYVQVLAVDLGWSQLTRIGGFYRFLDRRRSPRIERLTASRGNFWLTLICAPMIGPWLVMAFMRYAQVPQRRVALPILLGILVIACTFLPMLFAAAH
jgi:hypothetical protein